MFLFKMLEKRPTCMLSNSSQANDTTYVFCYDILTILHIEYVEYIHIYFHSVYSHPV